MLLKDRLSTPSENRDKNANIHPAEVAKFDSLAYEWRDPNGKFSTVLAFNRVRLKYIQQQISHRFSDKKICILDVGCGTGLLTQPLAEAGHDVIGIDASHVNIEVASRHAQGLSNLSYRHTLSDVLLKEPKRFDLVLNTEVLEHVPYPEVLLTECAELVKPKGMLVLATLNRTWQSYLIGIIGAEYVLRALPIGTHDWTAFVKPAEIEQVLSPLDFTLRSAKGMSFNPISKQWRLTDSNKVNYLVSALKA